jgi:hypothetical protein
MQFHHESLGEASDRAPAATVPREGGLVRYFMAHYVYMA